MAPFLVLLLETALRVQSAIAFANAANDLGNESEDDDEGDDDVWVDAEGEAVEDWEDALDEESVIENADGPNKTWTKNDGSRFPDSPAKFWVETETRPKQLPVSFHNNCALPCDFEPYLSLNTYSLWNSALVNYGDSIKIAEYKFV